MAKVTEKIVITEPIIEDNEMSEIESTMYTKAQFISKGMGLKVVVVYTWPTTTEIKCMKGKL